MTVSAEFAKSGTYTFFLTDIEGSTRMWDAHPDQMRRSLETHDRVVSSTVEEHGGTVVKARGEGDALFCVFSESDAAVRAAVETQRALGSAEWDEHIQIRIRIALHTGHVQFRDNDYYGGVVNRCARLKGAAHGGQIVCSRAVQSASANAAHFLDLGTHRLKDLSEPERIYQVQGDGLESDFPPLATVDSRPNNIPSHPSDLIGRTLELNNVVGSLKWARLVTLTGPGGAGKTRLASQAAAEVLPDYADGVWYVALEHTFDADAVPQLIATAMGLRFTGPDDLIAQLQAKETLLVLDNLEQVLDCHPFLTALLQGTDKVQLLVTSRERLRTRWEHEIELFGLEVAGEYEDESFPSSATQLFVERASQAGAPIAFNTDQLAEITGLCDALDGMPLAIELAAARLRDMPLHELTARWTDHLNDASRASRDLPARHQTLVAAIDWSVELLSEDEQDAFFGLSVFEGGFTTEYTDAVLGKAVTRQIPSLVDKSLIRRTGNADTGYRFAMIAGIRNYAVERLPVTVRDAHRDWFLGLVTDVDLYRDYRRAPERQYEILSADLDNVRAAMRHGLETTPNLVVDSVSAIGNFLASTGRGVERLQWHEASIAACTDDAVKARGLYSLGRAKSILTNSVAGLEECKQAVEIGERLGDDFIVFNALWALELPYRHTGDWEEHANLCERLVELARRIGTEKNVWEAEVQRASSYCTVGRAAEGIAELERLEGVITDQAILGSCLYELSGVLHNEGRAEDALNAALRALDVYRENPLDRGLYMFYDRALNGLKTLGRFEETVELAEECYNKAQSVGYEMHAHTAAMYAVRALSEQNSPDDARLWADRALVPGARQYVRLSVLCEMAQMEFRLGHIEEAHRFRDQAIEEAGGWDQLSPGTVMVAQCAGALAVGTPDAVRIYEKVLELASTLGFPAFVLQSQAQLAYVLAPEDPQRARALALDTMRQVQSIDLEVIATMTLHALAVLENSPTLLETARQAMIEQRFHPMEPIPPQSVDPHPGGVWGACEELLRAHV